MNKNYQNNEKLINMALNIFKLMMFFCYLKINIFNLNFLLIL